MALKINSKEDFNLHNGQWCDSGLTHFSGTTTDHDANVDAAKESAKNVDKFLHVGIITYVENVYCQDRNIASRHTLKQVTKYLIYF